jgi:hypothetical protein
MGRRFFVSPRVPDALNKNHYELIENCAANQRSKSKSSPLQQQRHVVVPLHRTSSRLHKKPNSDVVANAKPSSSASEARPLVLGNSGGNHMKNILFVPVPSSWYGKPSGAVMTFAEALKALDSDEQRQAVALMREIDMQLGIDAELSSSINDSPGGANVVIVHNIKTSLDSETLRYVAAIKGKVLLDEQPDKSEKPKPIEKPGEFTPKSSKITRGVTRIVYRPARRGRGLIITGMRGTK